MYVDEFRDLEQLTDDFPEDFFKMKVLPELLKSVEFGGGGPKAFGVVMKIATKLSSEDFEAKITPVLIRLFGNPDRAIRVCLLDNLPLMIDRLSQRIVNDKIFPQIVSWTLQICLFRAVRYLSESRLPGSRILHPLYESRL